MKIVQHDMIRSLDNRRVAHLRGERKESPDENNSDMKSVNSSNCTSNLPKSLLLFQPVLWENHDNIKILFKCLLHVRGAAKKLQSKRLREVFVKEDDNLN